MEILALLGLLLLGLLLAAPFVAFSALGKAKQALVDLAAQKALIQTLQDEVRRLRQDGVEPASVPSPPRVSLSPSPLPWPASPSAHALAAPPKIAAPPIDIESSTEQPPPATSAADAMAAADVPPAPELEEAAREAMPTAPKARDFEESIGSRWAVWVGGAALAMGGLFLVRYSIEAGLFGPDVRLVMGALFAVGCCAASEYVRRSDLRLSLGQLPPTQIPSILAGVGLLAAFGVVYAAHGVYGFIGPSAAFTLMGLLGIGALAASVLHGPLFGLFGLVGSYATPLLVSSTAPAFGTLSFFIAAVTGVAFFLHARRPERLVTLGAVSGHGVWSWLIATYEPTGKGWSSFLIVVASALGLALLKEIPAIRARLSNIDHPSTENWFAKKFDATVFCALAVPLVISGVAWVAFGGPPGPHIAILVTTTVALIAAMRHEDLSPLAPLAGAAATGMILLWPTTVGPIGVTPHLLIDLLRLSIGIDTGAGIGWTALLFAALAGALMFVALWRRFGSGDGDVITRGFLAFTSSLTPICVMLAAALRFNGFERSTFFAVIALGLTIVLFAASEIMHAVERQRTKARDNSLAFIASAAYAAGAAIALGLAIAFALRETWLFVGLAVAAAGVALVAAIRPIPLLRSMSGALATAAFVRFLWQPFLTDVGAWPLLNWLIPAYAFPALCFAAGAILLSGRSDRPRRVHEILAVFFATAFVLLEVRQIFAGADLPLTFDLIDGHWRIPRNRLFEEICAHVAAIGVIGAALQWLSRRSQGRVFMVASDIAAAALLLIAIAGLCGLFNPLLDGTLVEGPPILNRLILYVIVGALLIALSLATKRASRSRMSDALDLAGGVLIALGAVLVVRHAFAGPELVVQDEASLGFFEAVTIVIVLMGLSVAARILAAGGRRPGSRAAGARRSLSHRGVGRSVAGRVAQSHARPQRRRRTDHLQ